MHQRLTRLPPDERNVACAFLVLLSG
jgi:hypothetical protein